MILKHNGSVLQPEDFFTVISINSSTNAWREVSQNNILPNNCKIAFLFLGFSRHGRFCRHVTVKCAM